MRIGLLANVGGHFDAFWREIIGEYDRAGHEVFLGAGAPSKSLTVHIVKGISRRPSLANLNARRGVKEWVEENRLDVVITNTATPSFLARIANTDVPIIYFAHGLHWGNETSVKNSFWKFTERTLVSRTAGFIVINDEDEEWVRKWAPGRPCVRLRYGVGLNLPEFPRSQVPATSDIVWIGEFIERKRPLDAIKAMRLVSDRIPSATLWMLGSGPLKEEIEATISSLGLGAVVVLPGRVSPEPFISKSAVLLHTAKWEGLPRVALESLAIGRPVVGYRIKGLNGLPGSHLSSDGDIDDLASNLLNILAYPDRFAVDVDPSDLSWKICSSAVLKFAEELTSSWRK